MTKQELLDFENEIRDLYLKGDIKAPIHLGGDNEEILIDIFKNHYTKGDWVLGTWRNHYQWLLSGHDKEDLKKQILNNHSMHVFGDKFFTSAIVGGIAPIAVGIAKALKMQESKNKVLCFLGDMGASTGIALESMRYACGHDLPVLFIVEDNCLSVRTDTLESWGCGKDFCLKESCDMPCFLNMGKKVLHYEYKRKYNHAGPYENGDTRKVLF